MLQDILELFQAWLKDAYGKAREWVAPAYSPCTQRTKVCAVPSTSRKRMRCSGRADTRKTSWGWPSRTRTSAQKTPLFQMGERLSCQHVSYVRKLETAIWCEGLILRPNRGNPRVYSWCWTRTVISSPVQLWRTSFRQKHFFLVHVKLQTSEVHSLFHRVSRRLSIREKNTR